MPWNGSDDEGNVDEKKWMQFKGFMTTFDVTFFYTLQILLIKGQKFVKILTPKIVPST